MPTAISPEEVGESTRESALPWDRIEPGQFSKEGQLTTGRGRLRVGSRAAPRSSPDFRSLFGDLDSYDKLRTQKKLSLNLKTRAAGRGQPWKRTLLVAKNERHR